VLKIAVLGDPPTLDSHWTTANFVEVITQGHFDKGGRCPDGTLTVARSADKLAVGWFGSIKENTIVAYGTLSKK
jgi:hypothetical protein